MFHNKKEVIPFYFPILDLNFVFQYLILSYYKLTKKVNEIGPVNYCINLIIHV
jgi:hypothetical protein